MRNKIFSVLTLSLMAALQPLHLQATESLDVEQLLQEVIDHYPAIKTAYIQVASARQDNVKVQGQLGWHLGLNTGYAQEVSLFGVPVDQTTVGGRLARKLESGDQLSFSANINYEDAEVSVIPSLANPATSTELKLEYVKPLGKGADNLEYTVGLNNAKVNVAIKLAEQQILLDQMAQQIIDLYIAAINTQQRIENTQASIVRTKKLSSFINQRLSLGIVENKDELQTEAQLQNQRAQLSALKLAWQQQMIAINRLTGRSWDQEINLTTPKANANKKIELKQTVDKVGSYNPALKQIDSLIALADSNITIQKQNQQSNLDLKFYVGNKTYEGDSQTGNINNSDVVAGIQLEYQKSLDSSADQAALYQAQLQRGLQIQNKKLLLENIEFDTASLLAEITSLKETINAYQRSKQAEFKKLQDAEQRYKSGLIDIDQLIQFENQLSASDLAVTLQKLELNQRLLKLALMQGDIWSNIKLPNYDFENTDFESNEDEAIINKRQQRTGASS